MSLSTSSSSERTSVVKGEFARSFAGFFVLFVVPIACLEGWVRTRLFDHVSYSNSRSFDHSLRSLSDASDWNVVAIGHSELRWGLDPTGWEEGFREVLPQSHPKMFNLGIDGFSSQYLQASVPRFGLVEGLAELRVALVGLQLIERHTGVDSSIDNTLACDGDLKRPVFYSAFGRDTGIVDLCVNAPDTSMLGKWLEERISLVRYRSSLRGFMGAVAGEDVIPHGSTALPQHENGFQPHRSLTDPLAIRENEQAIAAKLREKAAKPAAFAPMNPEAWESVVAEGGYLDRWVEYFSGQGIVPVFVALPTNPFFIDLKNRRATYLNHAERTRKWALARGQVFVDLGIQDDLDEKLHWSDFRHLSGEGARVFSKELGRALARIEPVVRALTGASMK